MKRKDKHINKFLHDPLPDPEIPADDAWAGMNDMLDAPVDAASAHSANGAKSSGRIWQSILKIKGLIIVSATLATISAAIALVVFSDKTEQVQMATARVSTESENADDIATELNPVTERTENSIDRDNANRITTAVDSVSKSKENHIAGDLIEETMQRTKTGENLAKGIDNDIHTAQTQTSSHTRTRHAQAPVVRRRDAYESQPARGDFAGNAGNDRQLTESTGLSQNNITSSVSHENTAAPTPPNVTLNSLQPLSGHFEITARNLSKYIQKPALNAVQPAPKTRNPIFKDLHFGPEWNINRSIASTEYMFAGADSVKRPWRMAIPGLFVSKSWNRHSATLIFNPLHAYFGEKERVAQRVDSVRVTDSLVNITYHNTNFIKAFGINFSLQYQYQVAPWLSLVGGVSYARYSAALFKKETEFRGNIFPQAHLTVRNGENLKSYINPQQWSIRAGLLSGTPAVLNGRLQIGLTFILPISNLSLDGFKSVRSPNVQGTIRFLVR